MILKAVLLGIVEGVTEWLPISSTGHLLLLDEVLSLPGSPGFKDSFFVIVQLGAILAVMRLYGQKIRPLERGENGSVALNREALLLWGKTAAACLPGALAVLFLRGAEERLENPLVIAGALIAYGILFLFTDRKGKRAPRIRSTNEVRFRDALGVGLFQVLSVVPGTSRSGATILGGLALGLDRVTAAEFSFLLAMPVMGGYSAVKLLQNGIAYTAEEWALLLAGSGAAYLTSLLAIRKLTAYLKGHGFRLFAWYRVILGVLVLIRTLTKKG